MFANESPASCKLQDLEQPGRHRAGARLSLSSLPTQTILWAYDFKTKGWRLPAHSFWLPLLLEKFSYNYPHFSIPPCSFFFFFFFLQNLCSNKLLKSWIQKCIAYSRNSFTVTNMLRNHYNKQWQEIIVQVVEISERTEL